ncbi:hypothetical protein [uncultured Lacinutrix sp.]|uniref:hypothetical protein n=1 Tax=uncultured Lacinutrix sp. TaxID=574032 RepID=UPI0026036F57|nr:hypothetical protein [uncultured Lacinutrix sp.]
MKIFNFLVLVLVFGFVFNSCSSEEVVFQEENNTLNTQGLEKTSSASLSNVLWCDGIYIISLTNGPQMRSRVDLSWDLESYFVNSEDVTFNIEFQVGVNSGGIPTYGESYIFNEHRTLSAGSGVLHTFTASYNAISDLNGSVSGRWRVREEQCEWSDWKDHYFDL